MYRASTGTKTNKSKASGKSGSGNPTAGKQSKKRKAVNVGQRLYNKAEKAIGASAIAKRIMDLVGIPEPYNSMVTSGVGFARGGIEGGAGAMLVTSRIPEMLLGAGAGGVQGVLTGVRDVL